MLDNDIYVCFSYIPPCNSPQYTAHDIGFLESLKLNVRKYSSVGNVSIIGDLNARCGQRNDYISSDPDQSK